MNFFKIFFASFLAIMASIVCAVVIFVGTIIAMVVNSNFTQSVDSESVLVIDLGESIVDSPVTNPLSMVDIRNLKIRTQTTTLDAIRAIEAATTDDKIKGIYIRSRMTTDQSLALMEELRVEIENFRHESGKFVVAYGDGFSQSEYYLASVADSLYLQPEGMIVWQGIAANSVFYKGLLDNLNINVEVFRPTECRYKSAVEPLTRTNMSAESRRQNQTLIESMWSTVTSAVALSRGLTPNILNLYADNLTSFIAPDAAAAHLVDGLIYEDQLDQLFESLGVELSSKGRAKRVSLSNYITSLNFDLADLGSSRKVAVIYAEGVIVDGSGDVGEVGCDAMARILRKVRNDDDVKSVVLRVNSPGGSALAADIMWREVELLRQTKPVVVSMGSYAASGGYYISAPADMIIANDLTITGSIGVYGVLFDIEESLTSILGITFDSAKSNSSADFMHRTRPITASERTIMNRSVDQVYTTFTTHVANGRNLSLDRVHKIAQGRVWSGIEAQDVGLVDGIGGIKTAILVAAQRANIADNFEIAQYTPTPDDWSSIFAPLTHATKWDRYINATRDLKFLESKGGVVAHSPIWVE